MPSVIINATTVPVVVGFTAKAGDELLLVNGVCIGIRNPGEPFERTEQWGAVEVDKPIMPVAVPHGRPHMLDEDARIVTALEKYGPMTATHLVKRMRISPESDRWRKTQARIYRMLERGDLVRLDQDVHRPRIGIAPKKEPTPGELMVVNGGGAEVAQ